MENRPRSNDDGVELGEINIRRLLCQQGRDYSVLQRGLQHNEPEIL